LSVKILRKADYFLQLPYLCLFQCGSTTYRGSRTIDQCGRNFLSTIFSASKLNEDTLAKSWEAIVTVTLFIGGIIVLMLFSVLADRKANKKVFMEEMFLETAKVHSVYQQKLQSQQQGRSRFERTTEKDELNLFSLAENSLPQLLSSTSTANSWKGKIWTEEKKFHRWLGIIYYFSAIFPRILRVVSLASNIIIMLFIQSLTYNYRLR
jgi:hypothetical protein